MGWRSYPATTDVGSRTRNLQLFRSAFLTAAFTVLKAVGYQRRRADKPSAADPTVVVKCVTDARALATEGYDLRDYAARDNVEISIEWFELIQQNIYPLDTGVRYYFVAERKRPSIILPLRLTTNGRIRTVESLSNYYTSLYTPLVGREGSSHAFKHMLAAATEDHGGAHVMRFAPMDPCAPAFEGLLNGLREIGWIPYRYFCFGNWFLKNDDDWQSYLRKRSANLRSSIKRKDKGFSAAGGTLEVARTPEGIEQAIADYQEVYAASWKASEPYPDFIASLIRKLASAGRLRLGIARLQGRPIAAQLWIVSQDRASIYKVAYHESFASLSPGIVLTSHLLQYVIDHDRVREVDFLIGDDDYKQLWMSDRRERWGILAYNPRTFIGFGLCLKETLGRVAKSAVKKYLSRNPNRLGPNQKSTLKRGSQD